MQDLIEDYGSAMMILIFASGVVAFLSFMLNYILTSGVT